MDTEHIFNITQIQADMLKKHEQEIDELKKGLETAFIEIAKIAELSLKLSKDELEDTLE